MNSFQLGQDWSTKYKGMNPQQAKKNILQNYPDAQIQVIPQNISVPQDIGLKRVRIRIDGDGNVKTVKTG